MKSYKAYQRGVTLFELLTTMLLVGILLGIATFSYKKSEDTTGYAATEFVGLLKRARAKALVSTRSYFIRPTSSTTVAVSYGTSCTTAVPTLDNSIRLTLTSGATFTTSGWSICYTPRGTSTSSIDIPITARGTTKTVQVVLGGAVRII